MLVHVGHVRDGGQLAIGHVEKVPSPGEPAEQVPGGAMGLVVDHIAALGLKIDRHSTVLGDGEDEEQLLQIGPVVLVMSPGDRQPCLSAARQFLTGVGVLAEESHSRRIIVQFVQVHIELGDGVGRDRQGKRTTVALEQPVQATAHAIVVERTDLAGRKPQQVRIVLCRPLAHAVERLAAEQQVFQ